MHSLTRLSVGVAPETFPSVYGWVEVEPCLGFCAYLVLVTAHTNKAFIEQGHTASDTLSSQFVIN